MSFWEIAQTTNDVDLFHGLVFVDWKLDDVNLTVAKLELKVLLNNERRTRSAKHYGCLFQNRFWEDTGCLHE